MRFLTHLLCESPLWLGAFCFLLFGTMLFTRRRWESGAARRYAIPATLLIIALLFVVQKLVVTQREDIRLAMGAFVSAIERAALNRWITVSVGVPEFDDAAEIVRPAHRDKGLLHLIVAGM